MAFSPATEQRVLAFVTKIANICSTCLRRSDENCYHCQSCWANSILADIKADIRGGTQTMDYSLYTRMEKILSIIEKSGKPILSKDINLEGLCSFQLKLWTLKHMVKIGLLTRKVAFRRGNRKFYRYYTTTKGKRHYENHVAGTC